MAARKIKREGRISTLIVVPTYNEAGNLETVYKKIFKSVPGADLLVVDDGSPDGTGDLADRLAHTDRRVRVLHRSGKLGLGSAYVAGMKLALELGYDRVVAMDADLSHDPRNIPRMLVLSRSYDLVIGSRYVPDGGMANWGVFRLGISKSANFFLKTLLGVDQLDCTGGFKCYRAELLKKIGLDRIFSPGYSFQVEILFRALRAKARVVEIPILFVNRHKGESKLNLREVSGFFWTVLRLRVQAWRDRVLS